MKISMYLLERWFQEAGYKIYSAIAEGDARLVGARITDEAPTDVIAGIAVKDDASGLVTIINRKDILFITNASSKEVLNKATEAFEYYNNWEMTLLRGAFQKSSLQELLDIAVLAIRRPMLIKNSRRELCALTASYGAYVHPLWPEYLQIADSLPAPCYDYGKAYNELQEVVTIQEPAIRFSPSYCGNFMFANLITNDSRVGHISAYEHNRKFNKGDLQLMKVLQSIINFYVSANPEVLFKKSPMSDFMTNALTSDHAPTCSPAELFKACHWDPDDTIVMFLLHPISYLPAQRIGNQIEILDQALSYQQHVTIKNNAVFLLDLSKNGSYFDFTRRLSALIDSKDFVWAISNPFQDLGEIRSHYQAAYEALEYAIKHRMPGACVSDAAALHAIESMNQSESLGSFGHPAYHVLTEYDKANSTRFRETLFWYLLFNRNLKNVSVRMNLHRNTINNWVLKIEEILGQDDFDHIPRRLSYILTYLRENKSVL